MRWYTVYLVLAQTNLSILLCVTSIAINLRTLYWILFRLSKTKASLSLLIIIHIISWILLSIGWIIQNLYLITFWSSTSIQYNPKIIFFTYFGCLPFVPIPAVSLLFLTIERCLVFFYYNYQSMKRTQLLFVFVTIFSSALVYSFISAGLLEDASLRLSDLYICVTPNCQSEKTDVDVRVNLLTISFSFAILFALSILFYSVKTTHFHSSTDKFATYVTINIVLVQAALDILIHSSGFAATLILQENPVNIFGCYLRPISSLNGFLCSIIYSKNVKRLTKRNATNIGQQNNNNRNDNNNNNNNNNNTSSPIVTAINYSLQS